jgi:hypothetical protein
MEQVTHYAVALVLIATVFVGASVIEIPIVQAFLGCMALPDIPFLTQLEWCIVQ